MYAPPTSFYRGGRTPAPNIVVGFFLDTHDDRKAVRSLDSGCPGLELVRLDERHAVAVLKPGEASRLQR